MSVQYKWLGLQDDIQVWQHPLSPLVSRRHASEGAKLRYALKVLISTLFSSSVSVTFLVSLFVLFLVVCLSSPLSGYQVAMENGMHI